MTGHLPSFCLTFLIRKNNTALIFDMQDCWCVSGRDSRFTEVVAAWAPVKRGRSSDVSKTPNMNGYR